jgi:hypothetical protein
VWGNFLFSTASKMPLGSTQYPIQLHTEGPFPGSSSWGIQLHCMPILRICAAVLHSFIIWCLFKQKDNFPFISIHF